MDSPPPRTDLPGQFDGKAHLYDFGLADYKVIWQLQKDLVDQRLAGDMPNVLLLGEHPPVITKGRGTRDENLVDPTVPVLDIERGGDVTYHGPGQLVAYPILSLTGNQRDLHLYLRQLEEVVIGTLKSFGLWGLRNEGNTGVWVVNPHSSTLSKVASIGVAVKKWTTYHGLALNVSTMLADFQQIQPCGLQSDVMTSMVDLLDEPPTMDQVKATLVEQFELVFGVECLIGESFRQVPQT